MTESEDRVLDETVDEVDQLKRLERRPNPKEGLAKLLIELSATTAPHFVGDDKTRDLFEDLHDENGLPK